MIVKNESHLGTRVFENLSESFDAVCIVDTGSSDNTVEIYTKYFEEKKIPYLIHQSAWKGFDYSRNEAIEKAEEWISKKKGTWYLMFFDADDFLTAGSRDKILNEKFRIKRNDLEHEQYFVDIVNSNIIYERTLLVKLNMKKRFAFFSPIHEYLSTREENVIVSKGKIKGCFIDSRREGARSKDPEKYYKDAFLFQERMDKMNKGDKLFDRYLYYQAQSYRDFGSHDLAEKKYLERGYTIFMGDEYDYLALYEAAKIRIERLKSMKDVEYLIALKDLTIDDKTKLGCRGLILDSTTLKILLDANQKRNARHEVVVKICEHFRCIRMFNLGFALGIHTLSLSHKDQIFVNFEDHEFRLHDCVAVCASYIGKYIESKRLFEHILSKPNVPEEIIARTKSNLDFVLSKLNPKKVKAEENKEQNVIVETEKDLKKLIKMRKDKGRK